MRVKESRKQHIKMYKKGRFWVFAGITLVSFNLNKLQAHADDGAETSTAPETAQVEADHTATAAKTVPLKLQILKLQILKLQILKLQILKLQTLKSTKVVLK